MRGGISILHLHVGADQAPYQLLAPTGRRDQTDSNLDLTNVQFRMRHDSVGTHRHLRAAAEGQLVWRRNDGLGRPAQLQDHLLQRLDHRVQLVRVTGLRQSAYEQEVRSSAEVSSLVADHQPGRTPMQTLDGRVGDGADLKVQSVHLGMKLQQKHSGAHVQEAGGTVTGKHAPSAFKCRNADDLIAIICGLVLARLRTVHLHRRRAHPRT